MSAPFTPGLPPAGATGAFFGQDAQGHTYLLRFHEANGWEALGWVGAGRAAMPTLKQLTGDDQGLIIGHASAHHATPPATPVEPTASVEAVAKQLTWDGPFGRCGEFEYRVGEPSYTKGWRVWLGFCGKGASVGGLIVTTTAEDKPAAMAAAQADFSTRILASLTPAPTQGDGLAEIEVFLDSFGFGWREIFADDHVGAIQQLIADAPPTPSAPVSAPSPAGGVREALGWKLVPVEPTHGMACIAGENANVTKDEAKRIWSAMLRAAPLAPATPEPVSAPANGEVVEALKAANEALTQFTAFELDAREIMGNTNFEIVKLRQKQIRAFLAALSNPAPGHGEAVPSDAVLRLRQQLERRLQTAVVNADATGVPVDQVLATATVGVRYADLAALICGGDR